MNDSIRNRGSPKEETLTSLLEELKKRSNVYLRAWGKIYDLIHDDLLKMIFYKSKQISEYEAEEIINKTFDKVLKNAPFYRGSTDLSAGSWIKKIAKNEMADLFRAREKDNNHVINADIEDLVSETPDLMLSGLKYIEKQEELFHVQEMWKSLQGSLTSQEFEVLAMTFDGCKNSEISDKLGVSRPRVTQIKNSIKEKAKRLNFHK